MSDEVKQISPKSLKKISRKKFNMSYEWFIVAFVFLIISAVIFVCMIFSGFIGKIIFLAILVLLWRFFYTRLRNDELLENVRLTYQFYTRAKRGDTLVSKYNEASTRLIMIFLGILEILERGLIRYEGNIYYFIIQYTPKRFSDDSKIEHNRGIEKLLKSLKDGVQFQFNMNTTTKYNGNYEKQILSAANGKNVSRAVKEHLFSVQELVNKTATNIHPDFYIMCSLGAFGSSTEAQKMMTTIAGGLEYQFNALDTHFRILTSPEEITFTLYQKMTQGL